MNKQLQQANAEQFLSRHQQQGCFLMPNAWDCGSAKMLVDAGFDAIGTTSAGIAFANGRPDNGFCSPQQRVTGQTMLSEIAAICDAVSVPVNADLEAGFADSPEAVARTIEQAIAAGAVGGNIEDYTGDKQQPIYDVVLAVERIASARCAIDASGLPFVLVARTDYLNIGESKPLAQAIERANLYREAGADCLFAPGASDAETVKQLVRDIDGPINVVMGLRGAELNFQQLQDLGVRRVSIGGSLARSLYAHIRSAAVEMLTQGTFSYANNQIPQTELNRIFETEL